MNRLAVYSYLIRYTHGHAGTLGLAGCLQKHCQERSKIAGNCSGQLLSKEADGDRKGTDNEKSHYLQRVICRPLETMKGGTDFLLTWECKTKP